MAAPTTPTVILIVLYKIRLARRKWKKKRSQSISRVDGGKRLAISIHCRQVKRSAAAAVG
jgi:hypothetical protein